MSGIKFTPAQRFAIFTVHGATCYLNGEPLDLVTMRIDHVIPRTLKAEPERLSAILKDYGLPANFNLDSFANWLPACDPCNSKKYKYPFRPTLLFQRCIDQAMAKASDAEALAEKVVTNQAIARALNTIERAADQAGLNLEMLAPLVQLYEEHQRQAQIQEFRVTPHFTVLHEREGYRLVQTNYGVGLMTPSNTNLSARCPNCGSNDMWNGPRCLNCGQQVEGD